MKRKLFRSVKSEWQFFAEKAISPRASIEQRKDMRAAFISGYFNMITNLAQAIAAEPDPETLQKEMTEHMQEVQEELMKTIAGYAAVTNNEKR